MKTGFSIVELVIVVAVLAVIAMISLPSFVALLKTPQLNNTSEEIINTLKTAQNRTLSSEGNSQYGVYFDTTTSPHQYVLFKGSSYASRISSFDKIYPIPSALEMYATNLAGGGNQVVFDRLTGSTANSGNVSLRFIDDVSQTKIIYIDNAGVVGYVALSTPSDSNRVKDSRHIDFNYNRTIATDTENIILTFGGSAVQTIPMNQYLVNGQFYWSGTVSIGNANQTLTIHTLRLNNADTQFSIYRDMRFNTASLTIKLSGDSSGTVAEYSANGLTTTYPSIYVNSFAWQ